MGIKNKFIPLALSKNDNFKKTKKTDHFHQGKQHKFSPYKAAGDDACDMHREADGMRFS